MAYMRGHFYVFSSGDAMNIHHGWDHEHDPDCHYEKNSDTTSVSLPMPIFDELVAMHWARMSVEEQEETKQRAIAKYGGGSFGADGLMEEAGLPTVMDEAMRYAESIKDAPPPVVHRLTSNKAYRFVRIRVIGLLDIADGVGHIILGEKAPALSLKAMMWELRSPRLRRWNTRQYVRTDDTR